MGQIIPFIPTIAGAVGGIFGGKKATSSAMTRSPEEQAALRGGQQAGSTLTGQGTGMVTGGQQTLAGPTGYYQKLLSGNRALASQAVAAPRAAISDVYRGAERGLEHSGVRGAARDVASGELARQRAGQMSSLITGVQPLAAEALTGIGQTQTAQGVGAVGAGGNIFSRLLDQGTANRQYGRQEGEKFGSGFGGLIFDILNATGKFKGKGA